MEQHILKQWLKQAKEFETTGSFIMGVILVVLIVLGGSIFFFQVSSARPGRSVWIDTQTPVINTPQPTPQSVQQRMHTVKKSEGLWQIAQEYYKDGNQYLKIYEANKDKMKNPEDINEGMQLIIPD